MDYGAGIAWWKLIGGCLADFALLLLFLRLLGRLQGAGRGGEAALLGVHGVGPGRTIERFRWRESVYTVYRQDKSLVLLEKEPYHAEEHGSAKPAVSALAGRVAGWLPRRPA